MKLNAAAAMLSAMTAMVGTNSVFAIRGNSDDDYGRAFVLGKKSYVIPRRYRSSAAYLAPTGPTSKRAEIKRRRKQKHRK